MNPVVIVIVRFLHNLFTAVWIGGLLLITLTLFPALKKTLGHSAETEKIMDAVMRKQGKLVILAIIVLTVTGVLLARSSGNVTGLMRFDSQYASLLSLKHILMIVMAVLAFLRLFGFRGLASQPNKDRKKLSLLLLHINTLIGVAVLLLSAMTAAM